MVVILYIIGWLFFGLFALFVSILVCKAMDMCDFADEANPLPFIIVGGGPISLITILSMLAISYLIWETINLSNKTYEYLNRNKTNE